MEFGGLLFDRTRIRAFTPESLETFKSAIWEFHCSGGKPSQSLSEESWPLEALRGSRDFFPRNSLRKSSERSS